MARGAPAIPNDYDALLAELKARVGNARQSAAVAVDRELVSGC